LAPVIGFNKDIFLSVKKVWYALGGSFLLLVPVFAGYSYTIPFLFQILGLIAAAGVYSFYCRQIDGRTAKIVWALLFAGFLLLVLGYAAFADAMSGSQKLVQTWKVGDYKIDYIKDQGFSGGELRQYEISRYSLVRLLVKKLDYSVDRDTANSCLVYFSDINMNFDKCSVVLTEFKK
jgi:hypothetical protein